MSECEWKELKVDNLPPDYFDDNDYIFEWRKEKVNDYKWDLHSTITDNKHMSLNGKLKIIKNIKEEGQEYRYLKPEEKPLIVKSGGTWVAHWKGVDYLWTGFGSTIPPLFIVNCHIDKLWESFFEIEKEGLDDEIAKLRPMVKITTKGHIKGDIFMFTFIDESSLQCKGVTVIKDNVYCELATPHELQEVE